MTSDVQPAPPPGPEGSAAQAGSQSQQRQEFEAVVAQARAANGYRPLLRWASRQQSPEDQVAAWDWLRAMPAAVFWTVAVSAALQRQVGVVSPDPLEWFQHRVFREIAPVAQQLAEPISRYVTDGLSWERLLDDLRHCRTMHLKRLPAGVKKEEHALAFAAGCIITTLPHLEHPRWLELLLAVTAAHGARSGRPAASGPADLLDAVMVALGKAGTLSSVVTLLLPLLEQLRRSRDAQAQAARRAESLQEALAAAVEKFRSAEAEALSLREQVAALQIERDAMAARVQEAETLYQVNERVWTERLAGERRGLIEHVRRYLGQDADELERALAAAQPSEAIDLARSRIGSIRRFLAQLGG